MSDKEIRTFITKVRAERSCGNCGQKEHDTSRCPEQEETQREGYSRRPVRGGKNRILLVGKGGHAHTPRKGSRLSNSEDAVTLRIKIAGKEVPALLDTGAKPSVMDRKTLEQLGLSDHIQPTCSHVYGLGQAPVLVLGIADVKVRIGRAEATTSYYILDATSRHSC